MRKPKLKKDEIRIAIATSKKETEMTKEVFDKLTTNQVLSGEDIEQVVNEHRRLFGDAHGFNPIDKESCKFFVNRVKWFYEGNPTSIQTHLDWMLEIRTKPTRNYSKLQDTKMSSLTSQEMDLLKADYINAFTDAENLQLNSNNILLMIDRLNRLASGDELMVEFVENGLQL